MLFYFSAPLQNDSIVMSGCMQFTFGDKGKVYLFDESALPVTKKESMREGKNSSKLTVIQLNLQYTLLVIAS